jgi:hypothetical protein
MSLIKTLPGGNTVLLSQVGFFRIGGGNFQEILKFQQYFPDRKGSVSDITGFPVNGGDLHSVSFVTVYCE